MFASFAKLSCVNMMSNLIDVEARTKGVTGRTSGAWSDRDLQYDRGFWRGRRKLNYSSDGGMCSAPGRFKFLTWRYDCNMFSG